MTTLAAEEVRERLAAMESGPWADGIVRARRKLAPVDTLGAPAMGVQPIALNLLQLSTANKRKSGQLVTVLRAHFKDKKGVTDPAEIETRDALDEALTLSQLYELAVQTGYLPLESVRQPARELFTNLLWSPPARGFVADYDYVAVPMLAARVGVSELGPAEAPEPNERAALRFAGFLAHLRAFWADELIVTWTRFLDDYAETGEQTKLWQYLRGQRGTAPRRTTELLIGCTRFVTSLASAFYILDEDELDRFGLFHAYWLQKFFGYERVGGGYVKDVAMWGPTDSWARTIATSPHLIAAGIDKKVARVLRQQFRENVQLLNRTFVAVRRLAKVTRRRKAPAGTVVL